MITSVKEVMDFVYESYFARQDVEHTPPTDGSHPQDDRNNRRPDLAVAMLERLGQPDWMGTNVLVTGSKGKGSVSRLLELILRMHGKKTGLFTSPHLHDYNERIRINGEMIPNEDLIDMANLVQPITAQIQNTLEEGEYISPMANGLCMALTYFKHMETEYNILECGRGARFDDVASAYSDYAVINVIFDEHIPYLGTCLEDVAWHKAGVMKSNQIKAFSAVQMSEVEMILIQEANQAQVELDFVESVHNAILNTVSQSYNQANAFLAYEAARGMLGNQFSHTIAMDAIMAYPFSGCLERISDKPKVYMDGCIHPVCAKEITAAVKGNCEKRAVIGIPDNKSYKEVVRELIGVMDSTILSQPAECHLPFDGEQKDFAKLLKDEGKSIYHIEELESALVQALSDLPDTGELYIIGTQIYLGQVKSILKRRGIL